jgi:hypothetical protein
MARPTKSAPLAERIGYTIGYYGPAVALGIFLGLAALLIWRP